MTPEAFIAKWRGVELSERAASQDHFNELCDLLGLKKPTDADALGKWFTFEKSVPGGGKSGGGGFADVWRKDCFVWEYKRRKKPKEVAEEKGKPEYKTMAAALAQARDYAALLENPPLVIACDIDQIVIRTLFTGSVSVTHTIKLIDLNDSSWRGLLGRCFTDPTSLRPEITPQAVTEEAATKLATLAQTLRNRPDRIGQAHDPRRVAHFLNKIVFCLFAEDSGLLPGGVFSAIIEEAQRDHTGLTVMLADLFDGMRHGKRRFGTVQIPWFNGGLFDDDDVLELQFSEARVLGDAAKLDWASIDPTIFGTLFERGLDPAKRKEMANLFDAAAAKMSRAGTAKRSKTDAPNTLPLRGGANPARRTLGKGVGIHYTDSATIMKIVEPVVLRPLAREWDEVKAAMATLKTKAAKDQRYLKFRERLGAVRVLDPACGSGNFLFLTLRHLKDFDRLVEREAHELGVTSDPKGERVTPRAMLGIEINPYAAELARVTVWIGELQWQMRNGNKVERRPILGALEGIENRDALLTEDGGEAKWPAATFVIGNPPFVGSQMMLRQLPEAYVKLLRATYDGRVTGSCDLVCYWFAKATDYMSAGTVERAGLVSTQSIRRTANRVVLERVVKDFEIFDVWPDEPWALDGAAVRVSLVCFAPRSVNLHPQLRGEDVTKIFSDLTAGKSDYGSIAQLEANRNLCFQGPVKVGAFDIPGSIARDWLLHGHNPNLRPNSEVLRPLIAGDDIARRQSDTWIIDFEGRDEATAAQFEGPFEHIRIHVRPIRVKNKDRQRRENWWKLGRSGEDFRSAANKCSRIILTPRVSRHRLFVWHTANVMPDSRVCAICTDSDAVFGVLHSVAHQLWSLRLSGWHGVGHDPQYTSTGVFETFPFPDGLLPSTSLKDIEPDPRVRRIAKASSRLDELRGAWLNPLDLVRRVPEVVSGYPDRLLPTNAAAEAKLKQRTLTKLYNDRPAWLALAHRDLDRAVATAYGWPETLADRAQPENLDATDRKAAEDEILHLLLALNQERAPHDR